MSATDYRLTPADEVAVAKRISETIALWRMGRAGGPPGGFTSENVAALVRVGAHSIGCSLADLRDSEVDWIDAAAREALDTEAATR